ncbi:hypothetical protein I302_103451 [Kwoniella bestiolae CBS 10118]|uniref:Uncharacterized protein n=1 Tax=Kwoniella bestiolae CBS 10118 TaxID=1296100 RepID=A0A1B9G8J7_9TREE|nr:hypothetical protein I302_02151 [Kwoniella bestiolae CBS 10118]OCF27310.1 hypothetical protein I302_02151 [Kwoniella bestiolae CBS 10118]
MQPIDYDFYGPGSREQVYLVLTNVSHREGIVGVTQGQGTLTMKPSTLQTAMASKKDTVIVPLCNFQGYMEHVDLSRGGSDQDQEEVSHRYPVRGTISAYHTGHLSDDHVTSRLRGKTLLNKVKTLGLAFRDADELSNWFTRSLDPKHLTTDPLGDHRTGTFRFPVKQGLPLRSGVPSEGRNSIPGEPVDTTLCASLLHEKTFLISNKNDRETIPGLLEVFDGRTGLKGQSRVGFMVKRSEKVSDDQQMIKDAQDFYAQSPPGRNEKKIRRILELDQKLDQQLEQELDQEFDQELD